jgi:hypothetical protein
MYVTANNLVHYLISRGLVTPEGVVDGDFTVLESRRRNRNYRVLRKNAASLFIKQVPMVIAETTASLHRESVCYRLAADTPELGHLQDLMPRLLDYNSVNHTIVTELVENAENLNEYHQRVAGFPEAIAELQAAALARVHAATANVLPQLDQAKVFTRMRPWVLSILQNAEMIMPDAAPPMKQLTASLRQQPDIVAALATMQENWHQTSLIHGDVKWDNFVLAADVIRLVDWELADIGDPAWDVACVFASYIQPWLFTLGDGTARGPVSTNGAGMDVTWPAIRAFWRRYVREMNLTAAAAELQLLRSAYYTGGRLILTAFEILNGATEMNATVQPVVQLAQHVILDPRGALRDLLGINPADPALAYAAASTPTSTRVATKEPPREVTRLAQEKLPAEIRQRLEVLFDNVDILSPASFRFADNEPVVLPPLDAAPAANADRLVEALWPVVYTTCYTRDYRGDAALRDAAAAHAPQSDPAFVALLSAANRSRTRWDPAWEVYQVGTAGTIHVKKREAYRVAKPGEYAYSAGPGLPAGVGARVELLVLRESHAMQHGFYFAFGETIPSEFDDAQLSRVYFNATADGICGVLEYLSTELNRFGIPYRFKCLDNRAAYDQGRGDSAVLYIAKRFARLALGILDAGRNSLGTFVNPHIPLFTKEILPGVSAADEPGTGESFGQSRMRLVSRGIVDAWLEGKTDIRSRFEAVESRFKSAGLSLARPHLNHGNSDLYDIPAREVSH